MSTSAREAFILEQCAKDDELRDKLRALLAAHFSSPPREEAETAGAYLELGFENRADREIGESPDPLGLPGPGERLAHYTIIRELGRGGMGAVFLARDGRLDRHVALKFVLDRDPDLNRRFHLEARATAQCKHEHIVVIHDVGTFQEYPYMVLEYIAGKTLRALLRAEEQLSPAHALAIIKPVVDALVCAHERDIVHRDLKPENIMVASSGGIKVMDFGIAKDLSHDLFSTMTAARRGQPVAETQPGLAVGTLAYMAPEQWGIASVDQRSDIWAVGIMLYEMIAGHHPVMPTSPGRLFEVVANLVEPMPSASQLQPDIGALAGVIDRCLGKRKIERYQTAKELLDALERAAASASESAARPLSRPATTRKGYRRGAAAAATVKDTTFEFAHITIDREHKYWQHHDSRPEGSPFECPCAAWLHLEEGTTGAQLPLDVTLLNLAQRPVLLTALGLEVLAVHWNFTAMGRSIHESWAPASRTPYASRVLSADRYAFDSFALLPFMDPHRKEAITRLRAALKEARGTGDPARLQSALAEHGAVTVEIGETYWHDLSDPVYQDAGAPYRYGLIVEEFQDLMPANLMIRLSVKSQLGAAYSDPVEVFMPASMTRR